MVADEKAQFWHDLWQAIPAGCSKRQDSERSGSDRPLCDQLAIARPTQARVPAVGGPTPVGISSEGSAMARPTQARVPAVGGPTPVGISSDYSDCSPCRDPPLEYRFDLPMPTVVQARALLRTYPWTTAVGADAWRPRSLELLSDEMVDCMIQALTGMVKFCANPSMIDLLIIHLIPKPDFSYRLILGFPDNAEGPL